MPAISYLSRAEFGALTLAPSTYLDEADAASPSWVITRLARVSGWINSRLAKRYAVPFAPALDDGSYPETVQLWLTALVTCELYLKRGVDPTDRELSEIIRARDSALAEIREAADSRDGLFELPLRADLQGTDAITKGAPLGYSEVSPYTWSRRQRDAAENE